MKNALTYIISGMVDKPDEVEILEEENQGIVNFTIKVSQDDMGKVIGKEGKVIRAIRNVMRIPGVIEGKKIYVTLSEN